MNSRIFSLDGKTAIVTGASRGIGKEIAIGLATQGASVVLASRSVSDLEKVSLEIKSQGGRSISCQTDVSNEKDISNLIETTLSEFGTLDILVNNAAISPIVTRAENLSKDDWNTILLTNLIGAFFCAKEAGKIMMRQEKGCIINISSFLSVIAMPGLVAYSAAKAGLMEMTRALALEWAKYNIRVNAIGPGWIETDMNREIRESKSKFYLHAVERIPMRRFGKAKEIVGAAIFLASEEASYITGQTLFVDGGLLAC